MGPCPSPTRDRGYGLGRSTRGAGRADAGRTRGAARPRRLGYLSGLEVPMGSEGQSPPPSPLERAAKALSKVLPTADVARRWFDALVAGWGDRAVADTAEKGSIRWVSRSEVGERACLPSPALAWTTMGSPGPDGMEVLDVLEIYDGEQEDRLAYRRNGPAGGDPPRAAASRPSHRAERAAGARGERLRGEPGVRSQRSTTRAGGRVVCTTPCRGRAACSRRGTWA